MIKKFKKSNFYKNKKLFKIDDINIDKILFSIKEPYGTNKSIKYFFGYNDDDVIRPLCIKLPQMIGYVKFFESNKTMSVIAIDNKLLEKYNLIWKKFRSLLNIKFDRRPIYGDNDKYIKKKIKIYDGNIYTSLQGNKIPKKSTMKMFIINDVRFCC